MGYLCAGLTRGINNPASRRPRRSGSPFSNRVGFLSGCLDGRGMGGTSCRLSVSQWSRSFPRLILTHQGVFQDADLLFNPLVVHSNIEAWFPHGSFLSIAIMPCTLACTGPLENNPVIVLRSRLSAGTAATCF
jgi:hypothetical protein